MSNTLLMQLNYLLYFSTAVISFNQRILKEKNFIYKVLDDDETFKFSEELKIQEDNSDENQIISEILSRAFKILEYYITLYKGNDTNNINYSILEGGIFYFLKNFCKLFLSKSLSNKYLNIFPLLTDILKLNDNSMILTFIISFIVEICKNSNKLFVHKNEHALLQDVIKIFDIIVSNCNIVSIPNSDERFMYVGKLTLHESSLNSLIDLHSVLNTLDPITFGKYRKIFYHSITKIILIRSNTGIFDNLLMFYIDNLVKSKDLLKGNDQVGYMILGYMKDLLGICSSIATKTDYKIFFTKLYDGFIIMKDFYSYNCHLPEVNIAYLKLLENVSKNSIDRISFPSNCILYY